VAQLLAWLYQVERGEVPAFSPSADEMNPG
jgi:hypothetical protein